jgi:Tol biopolymer transport system component
MGCVCGGEPLSIFWIAATDSASARVGDRVGRLTQPPLDANGDMYPALSPDGQWLAFARYTTTSAADVFIVPAKGGDVRRLTNDEAAIEDLTWTPDSQAVVSRRTVTAVSDSG